MDSRNTADIESVESTNQALITNRNLDTAINRDPQINADDTIGDMTIWNVFKSISAISIPTALSDTFSFDVFITSLLLIHISENENDISAVNLITIMMGFFVVMGISPLLGMSILASNQLGELQKAEKDGEDETVFATKREAISGIYQGGLAVSACIAPLAMLPLIFSESMMTTIFKQDPTVSKLAQDFLRIYSLSIPATLVKMSAEQLIFAFGGAKITMAMGLVNLGIGTSAAVLFGKGLLNFPKLGPAGVALGFVAETYLTAFAYTLYLGLRSDLRPYRFLNLCHRINQIFKHMRDVLKMGLPISLSLFSEMGMEVGMGIFAGLVGTREQAAMSFAMQVTFFTFIISSAFSQGSSQELSRLIGANRFADANRVAKFGLLTSLLYTAPIPIAAASAPTLLTMTVSNDRETINEILKYLVPMTSIGVMTDALRNNLMQQLRSLDDLHMPTLISMSSIAAGMTASGLLSKHTSMGVYGITAGYCVSMLIASAGLMIRWRSRIKPENIQETMLAMSGSEAPISSNMFSMFSHCCKKTNHSNLPITDTQSIGDYQTFLPNDRLVKNNKSFK